MSHHCSPGRGWLGGTLLSPNMHSLCALVIKPSASLPEGKSGCLGWRGWGGSFLIWVVCEPMCPGGTSGAGGRVGRIRDPNWLHQSMLPFPVLHLAFHRGHWRKGLCHRAHSKPVGPRAVFQAMGPVSAGSPAPFLGLIVPWVVGTLNANTVGRR